MRTLIVRAAVIAALALVLLPGTAAAHVLTERYQAPLPLVAYIAGAALAVAMSFAFVMLRGERAAPAPPDEETRHVPRWLRRLLGAIGLGGWLWIMAQGLFGGQDPTADVGHIFLWVYGWVGLALLSALLGPVWPWLDPFSTLHRLAAAGGRRLGLVGDQPTYRPYPAWLGIWPAVIGFAVVVWLELVAFVFAGPTLAMLLLAYTLLTLAGMSWFGRSAWRSNAEIFTVWFGLLGRLAPFALAGEAEDGRVRRRPFAAALLHERWGLAEVVLVTLGTGAVIFDGLSQTRQYFDLFGRAVLLGAPDIVLHTLVAAAFFAAIIALVLVVGRLIGSRAIGAGLLPVAVGYIAAHYVVSLLVDGQRIVLALNDPLLRGEDLLPHPWSAFEPTLFLPASLIWAVQLAAVVGGHVLGAWAGHAALEHRDALRPLRQLPLAALMVFLTSITLWSLGQEVVEHEASRPSTMALAGDLGSAAGDGG